jgi:hypothetical protein
MSAPALRGNFEVREPYLFISVEALIIAPLSTFLFPSPDGEEGKVRFVLRVIQANYTHRHVFKPTRRPTYPAIDTPVSSRVTCHKHNFWGKLGPSG